MSSRRRIRRCSPRDGGCKVQILRRVAMPAQTVLPAQTIPPTIPPPGAAVGALPRRAPPLLTPAFGWSIRTAGSAAATNGGRAAACQVPARLGGVALGRRAGLGTAARCQRSWCSAASTGRRRDGLRGIRRGLRRGHRPLLRPRARTTSPSSTVTTRARSASAPSAAARRAAASAWTVRSTWRRRRPRAYLAGRGPRGPVHRGPRRA